MAGNEDEIVRRSGDTTYTYEYYFDAPSGDALCAHCRGTGKIALLVSAGPCEKCEGTGRAARQIEKDGAAEPDPSTPPEAAPGRWVSEFKYDARSQLLGKRWFVPDERAPEMPTTK